MRAARHPSRVAGRPHCSWGLAGEVVRQAEAGALDVIEEGEAGSQGVNVDPEQLCSLEVAARLGEHVSEFVDGDEPLGGFAYNVDLDIGWLTDAMSALEVDELVDEGASRFGNGLLDGEPDGSSVGAA